MKSKEEIIEKIKLLNINHAIKLKPEPNNILMIKCSENEYDYVSLSPKITSAELSEILSWYDDKVQIKFISGSIELPFLGTLNDFKNINVTFRDADNEI